MIPPEHLKVSTYPERARGGQHVGTVTGVRVEHEPTGLVAICTSERSQHKNRLFALHMIEAALTHPDFRGG